MLLKWNQPREITIPALDIPLFQGLSESELSSLKSYLKEKSFAKGETLFLEGKACERIFIVKSGRVKVYRTSSSGREQILETLGPGDTCACNPGTNVWSCSSTAEALTSCTVWFFSREEYVHLVQTNFKLSKSLNHILAHRLQCFGTLIEEVALKDSKKRIVKFLLDMHANQKSKAVFDGNILLIPFTREEIAQRTGMARETVARQLYQLKRAKLIDLKPQQIVIKDEQGLFNLLT